MKNILIKLIGVGSLVVICKLIIDHFSDKDPDDLVFPVEMPQEVRKSFIALYNVAIAHQYDEIKDISVASKMVIENILKGEYYIKNDQYYLKDWTKIMETLN